MNTKNLFIVLIILAVGGIIYTQSKTTEAPVDTQKNEASQETASKTSRSFDENMLCYGEKTLVDYGQPEFPSGYSYSMLVFDISDPQNVEGYARYYPYGTDSNVGSIKGTYDADTNIIKAVSSSYGEGMTYDHSQIWRVEDDMLISGYLESQMEGDLVVDFDNFEDLTWNTENPQKRISCDQLDTWLDDVYAQWNEYDAEVDYERIARIMEDPDLTSGVTSKMTDLDNNWETEETIFYLGASDYCGTGGCTMIVVDKNDTILDKFTVTRKPILVNNTMVENTWKDLVVWSDNSYRLLKHTTGGYPSNPSLETKLSERDVEWHPEKYFTVMHDHK